MEETAEGELECPGLVFRNPDNVPFNEDRDADLLEARIEGKIGENKIKCISWSEDHLEAYLELTHKEDIDKMTSFSLKRKRPVLMMEKIDLMGIKRFYLRVKGLEDWMDEEMVKEHFYSEAGRQTVESVEIEEGTAIIRYACSKVALRFKSMGECEMLGSTVTVEVDEEQATTRKEEEDELVLGVRNLPVKIPAKNLQTSLKKYMEKHVESAVERCFIKDGIGYVFFEDSSVVSSVVANPPGANFFARVQLEYFVSNRLEVESLDDPYKMEEAASLTSSLSSSVLQSNLSRNTSMESASSINPNFSIGRTSLHRSRNQVSNSSDDCEVDGSAAYSGNPSSSLIEEPPLFVPVGSPKKPELSTEQMHIYDLESLQSPREGWQQRSLSAGDHSKAKNTSELSDLASLPTQSAATPQRSSHDQLQMSVPAAAAAAVAGIIPSSVPPAIPERKETKILVENVPPAQRNDFFITSYLYKLTNANCLVKQYGENFLATFNEAIDLKELEEKQETAIGMTSSFTFTEVPDTRKLLVENIPDHMKKGHIKIHFRLLSEEKVELVEMLSSTKAIITFQTPSDLNAVKCKPGAWGSDDDDFHFNLSEYYDFMSVYDMNDSCNQLSKQEPLNEILFDLKASEILWLRATMNELNSWLSSYMARCSVNKKDPSGSQEVIISPLPHAESVNDWELEVKKVMEEYLSCYFETKFKFSMNHIDIVRFLQQSADNINCLWKIEDEVVILYGLKSEVNRVYSDLNFFVEEVQVEEETKQFSRRHVTYVSLQCRRQLKIDAIEQMELCKSTGEVFVKGTASGRQKFWEVIEQEGKNVIEKKVQLSLELSNFLQTGKGIKKIEELMGVFITTVVYCLEKDDDGVCCIYFLCNTAVGEKSLKHIKRTFKSYLAFDSIPVESSKIRFCLDVNWSKNVDNLKEQHFVCIVLDQASNMIKIAGERMAVANIRTILEEYLLDISSIEEHLVIDYYKWRVIDNDLKHKVDAIVNDFGKNIKIIPPKNLSTMNDKPVTITIQGDPNAVDDAKVRLQLLEKEVFHLQEKLSNIPAAHRLLSKMEDRINVIEHNHNAYIDIKIVAEDDVTSNSNASNTRSHHPTKIGGAILSNEVRVFLYSDNFTKHPNVHTIINFVKCQPANSDFNLKRLFETKYGDSLQMEFYNKIKKAVHLRSGSLLKMDSVDGLDCTNLFYAFIPCWAGGKENEEYYLEQCLLTIQSHVDYSSTILLTSVCTEPLLYPSSAFAKQVMSCFSSSSYSHYDITVAVYLNDASDATEFNQLFDNPKFGCRSITRLPQSQSKETGKIISNPINTFITLTQGNLLDQQVDVYVSSTSNDLELKNAAVSKALLAVSGEDLQKECSLHAPLRVSEVAVTGAKNLKCKHIFHVVLPHYNDQKSERKFRKGIETILRIAKEKDISSIAIPSLGIGNLNFPAGVSAKIMYEEIINFKGQNPKSSLKFIVVIFEQKHFKEFSKIHAQKMGSETTKKNKNESGAGTRKTMLSIECSDISDENTDVIVNTTTETMELSESAVSKALLQKAGASLQQACNQLVQDGFRLDHGQIVDTSSYGSLKCQKLIHAHVPQRSDAVKASTDHFSLIHDIVWKCLRKAEQLKLKSISFPAFGFGQGGYSINEVASPILTALQEFGKAPHESVEAVHIVIYDQTLYDQFYSFFLNFFKVSDSSRTWNPFKARRKCIDLQNYGPGENVSSLAIASAPNVSTSNSCIVFKVYASTEAKCHGIVDQLQKLTREVYKEEVVVNSIIRSLIDTDINKIMALEKTFQVSIKIEKKIHQIVIQGEGYEVLEAKGKINNLLYEIEKDIQLALYQFEWYTCGDGDDEKEKYSVEDSFMLERAFQCKEQAVELVIDNVGVVITLQSDPMEETNGNSGSISVVKRVRKKQSDVSLPDYWEDQHKDANGKPKIVCRILVKEGTVEYQNALKRFKETIGSQVTIIKLERIQNLGQYSLHLAFKEDTARKYNRDTVEVKQLFHGLKEDSVDPVMTTGFNRSFAATANAAYYGVGVYFALNASYSAQVKYAIPDKDKVQYMFICSVVIGKYTQGKQGMKAPPPLQQGSSLLYDTLVEKESSPTIFVAVKDAQAYPDYLVSFKKN